MRSGEKRKNDFEFGTFIDRFPSDGAAGMTMKGLTSTDTTRLIRDGETEEG